LLGVLCLTMKKDGDPFGPLQLRLLRELSWELGSLVTPLAAVSELRHLNDSLLELFRHSSDLLMERDGQVAEACVQSANIVDSIPIAVVAYDRQLQVRRSNPVAEHLFGAEASIGWYYPLEDGLQLQAGDWRRRLENVIADDRESRLQRVAYAREGEERTLDIQLSPLRNSRGEAVGGIVLAQDVTADVEMEEKLSSAERLAFVGKIAAKVAHELNNPLDGIMRFLNLAVRRLENDPQVARGYLQECRQGLHRMSHILAELLTFSRSHREVSRPVRISHMIRDCIALYEERAQSQNIAIRVDAPAELPYCRSPQLFEALSNVVKNALDAMGENGVLSMRAEQVGDQVRLAISDTGPGVPEEDREKIFEPFFTTKEGDGTGLGLAVCRDTLARVGGQIRLCPSEQGACFEILVPACELEREVL